MSKETQVAHIIYLRSGPTILSKVRYSNWHDIQDDYEDYMTSLGPWDVVGILSYFEEEFKEESSWLFSREQIRNFMSSGEHLLTEDNLNLEDLQGKSATTIQFNEYINSLDIEGLTSLMTDDHTFIDSENDVHEGKEMMSEGWRTFFESYPDYRNIFKRVEMKDGVVVMVGHSICSIEPLLDGPALWSAKIRDGLVAEWRVYRDTDENRADLGI
ncbi:MAG: nuclear transport factor 2 family protein [Candidatus Thorarchaeota archaeon]|nr:MAG: nuclear transport factor 2 family protein [Candidatus Thorarchaeota archaeon]